MKVMIFTEGGKRTGFGHISRCVALYDEVQRRGIQVELIVHSHDELYEIVGNRECTLINWYTSDVINQLIPSDSYCIVDSYIASKELYQEIKKRATSALFLDDTNRMHYPEGIVVHPSLSVNDVPSNSLAGSKYIILREGFRESSPSSIPPNVKNVLITLGGTLQPSLVQSIMQTICYDFNEITFHLLIGNLSQSMLEEKNSLPSNIVLYRYLTSNEMKQLMKSSDLIITAAGQTIYEILALGVPFIPVQIVDNQERNMQALCDKEIINSKIVWESSIFKEHLKKDFIYMLDQDARRRQVAKYDGIVDGKGPQRIIDSLLHSGEGEVFLREAMFGDSRQIFDLSNQYHVRKYSINPNPILWETHQGWFSKVLSSQAHLFLIVTDGSDQVLGQIRYEFSGGVAVISISLSKKLIGKKVSQPLIKKSIEKARQKWNNVQKIVAYISNDNLPSKRTFEKAGFRLSVAERNDGDLLTYIYKTG